MKSFWALSAMAGALSACATPDVSGTAPPAAPAPVSAKAALDLYYGAIPDAALPVAPAGQPLPDENQVISLILL
ncbi:MAG: hypothetical protein AAGA24_04430, partial [Pseudomonadota bacterium]